MKRSAFTLVETVIVFAIALLIITLTSPSLTRSRQSAAERQFFTRLKSCWDLETNRARSEKRRLSIYANGRQMNVGNKVIKLPATLSTPNFAVLNVGDDGFTAPHTRVLYSKLDRSRYVMKIQMGWGGYRIEKVSGW
ncbi:type II secretion system protein [uncultured Limosilactobacillus sp.]|uniref:type II secretion system protein n=1 Tax=uncultured Limosilactobacillus sp. TaxID=2837629 RepID=UPI0025E37873|nr:type II secretion system protein [uncultured Limosilactobacillus sp.]